LGAVVETIKQNKSLSEVRAGTLTPGLELDELMHDLEGALEENHSLTFLSFEPKGFSDNACIRNKKNVKIPQNTTLLHAIKRFNSSNLDKYVISEIFDMSAL
jgi:hypothetical protein